MSDSESESNSATNYSESDPGISSSSSSNSNSNSNSESESNSNSNSNTEVVFGKTIKVRKPRSVKFATRRRVRKTNKTPAAVESRKGYKKKKRGPYVTKNMNAENRKILKNATRRLTHSKEKKQQRAWAYIDYLKMLKEEEGKDFLTEEQRNFIKKEILGWNSNSN